MKTNAPESDLGIKSWKCGKKNNSVNPAPPGDGL